MLPAYLGVLLFIPVFLLARSWGNTFSGLLAGLVALCAPYYVRRTSAGWYDTDCGVVTLAMTGVLLSFLVARSGGKKRLAWLAAVACYLAVFLMWWDTAPEVALAIGLVPIISAYLFLIGPRKRDLFPLAMTAIVPILVVGVWKGPAFWESFLNVAWGLFRYISKAEDPHFPNIGVTISEQVRVSFQGIVALSAGSWFVFVSSIAGLALLLFKNHRLGLQLMVPLALGILTVYAKRFAIFMTPLVALGAGHLFFSLWKISGEGPGRWVWRSLFGLLCLGMAHGIWSVSATNRLGTYNPVEPPRVVEGIALAREDTPPNSVIWAWWDHGYPVMYWSRRATISDGTYHGGQLSFITAFPLVSSDYRQAANWIHFYVVRGLEGFQRVFKKMNDVPKGLEVVKAVLAAGPESSRGILVENGFSPPDDWIPFFFPPRESRRPVYFLVDERLVGTSYWWYWLGSWDPGKRDGIHPFFRTFSQVRQDGNELVGLPPFSLDLEEGVLAAGNVTLPVSRMIFHDGKEWQSMNYSAEGLVFQHDAHTGWGTLCSADIFGSVFNKLFFLRMADVRYFKPTRLKTSSFQLWEVHGEEPPTPIR